MAKPFFAEQFSSTMDAVGGVLQAALGALIERGWVEPDQRFYAQLCLEEALVNAVDHGNKCDPAKSVRIEMSEDADVCVIRVYDEGGGFSPEDIHLPRMEQPNGRGDLFDPLLHGKGDVQQRVQVPGDAHASKGATSKESWK